METERKNVINFRTSGYFHWYYYIIAIIFLPTGLALLVSQWMIGVVLLVLSILILTTHYRMEVNFRNKTYHDHLWILWMKKGEKKSFEKIDFLFIKSGHVSQTMHYKSLSSTVEKTVYDGYIQFSVNDKVHMLTKDDEEVLYYRLEKIAAQLGVEVKDVTEVN